MMRSRSRFFERALCGAMHVCWLYAWFGFALYAIFNIPVSPAIVCAVYVMGVLAARIGLGGGARRIWTLLARLTLFGATWWWTVTVIDPGTEEIVLTPRLDLWLLNPPGAWPVFCLVTVSFLFIVVWQTGAALGYRPFGQKNVFVCFDKGLSAFSLLLIVKLMMSAKGGIHVPYPGLIPLFMLFFMFGFWAIGLVRIQQRGDVAVQRKFAGLGVAFSTVAGFFAAVTAAVVLAESRLYEGAGQLSRILHRGAVPVMAWIESALKAWFSRKRGGPLLDAGRGGDQSSDLAADMLQGGPPGFWETIFTYFLMAFFAAIGIAVLCLGLWVLFRWLYRYLSERNPSGPRSGPVLPPIGLPAWLKNLLFRPVSAKDMYRFLTRWGRFSGLSRRPVETPTEYAGRLSAAFPPLGVQFWTIAGLFNEDVYGPRTIETGRLVEGKTAVGQLRHPRHFLRRLWRRLVAVSN